MLYDLDMNSTFTIHGIPLNFIEFAYAVNTDQPYEVIALANDTKLDVSNFKDNKGLDYAFFDERINSQSCQWYKRVLQVPFIENTFFDEANRKRINEIYPARKFMMPDEFKETFYGKVRDKGNEK